MHQIDSHENKDGENEIYRPLLNAAGTVEDKMKVSAEVSALEQMLNEQERQMISNYSKVAQLEGQLRNKDVELTSAKSQVFIFVIRTLIWS